MMKKELQRTIIMGLLCASVIPGVGYGSEGPIEITKSGDYTYNFTEMSASSDYVIKVASDDATVNLQFSNDGGVTEVDTNNGAGGLLITTGNVVVSGNDLNFVGKAPAGKYSIENYGNAVFENKISVFELGNTAIITGTGSNTYFNNNLDVSNASSDQAAIINKGNMEINSNWLAIATANGTAIVNDGGKLLIKQQDSSSGSRQIIIGDIEHRASNGNTITDITLSGEGSGFQGIIIGSDDNFSLTLEEGTTWMMTQPQVDTVHNFALNGGSVWLYMDNAEQINTFTNLNLHNFNTNGNGMFYLHTNLEEEKGDRINFTGTTPNVSTVPLSITDYSSYLVDESEGKKVIVATAPVDSSMDFSVEASARYSSDYYAYLPVVSQNTNGNQKEWTFVGWQMVGGDPLPPEEIEPPIVDPIDPPVDPPVYPPNRDDRYIPHIDPMEAYISHKDVEPLFKRLNDLRTDPSEVGVWIRGETGETKIRNYKYDFSLMTGGYDWISENDARNLFAGFGVAYSTNECSDKVVGDTDNLGFNLYGSWLGKKNNDYVDLVIRYGTLDKEYAGYDHNRVFVKGDYKKKLFTIAAKYGRRIFVDNDWYYEPFAGLTWGRVGSADFVDNQYIPIHADSTYSTIAALGMQVGKNIKGIEYYGKLELMHDFDGKIHVSAPGLTAEDDMGGTWCKVAIGASKKINSSNSFYLDLEKDFGNKVKKPYAVSFGYRYTW